MSRTSPHTYLVTLGTGTHVQTTAPDGRVDVYTAEIISSREYSAYGAELPGCSFALIDYRYSFNGQEKETEITGSASHTSAEFWMYDSRLGRRWEVDLVVKYIKSAYLCFSANPIWKVDPQGDNDYKVNGKGEITLIKETDDSFDRLIAVSGKREKLKECTMNILKDNRFWLFFISMPLFFFINSCGRREVYSTDKQILSIDSVYNEFYEARVMNEDIFLELDSMIVESQLTKWRSNDLPYFGIINFSDKRVRYQVIVNRLQRKEIALYS